MRIRTRLTRKPLLIAILLLLGMEAWGAQSGKIAGRVRAEDGTPIVGANVVIEGTRLGAATDLDGRYFIIAVPPGNHKVQVSALGYRPEHIEGVGVASDRTTTLDVDLGVETVDLEPVTVTYRRPPVDLKETSQRISVDGAVARQMPVNRAEEMVLFQAGVAVDADGTPHIRGGRAGELGYFIDGMRIEDPLFGEQAAEVGREGLQEMQLLSGTFSAEYGEAMSGVVNILTREGQENYDWSFEYQSPRINSSPYRMADWVRNGSDAVRDTTTNQSLYSPTDLNDTQDLWLPIPGRFSLTLSGPVPMLPRTTFFLNGVSDAEESYLPFGDFWTRRLTGKVTHSTDNDKFALSFGLRSGNRQTYNHTWKYVPDQYHRHFEGETRASLTWTRTISNAFFYEVTAGSFSRHHDVKIFDDWADYVASDYSPEDFTFANYFYDQEDWSDTWRESRTRTWSGSGKFTWQANQVHQFRGGVEGQMQNIDLEDIRDLRIGSNGERLGLVDSYTQEPLEASAFLQDKIELDYLVVNAGLRLDHVNPRASGWTNPENPTSPIEDVEPSTQVSPRLGLAHPVSETMTLHFAYGHFFQFPDYVNLFLNSSDLNPDTLANRQFDAVGNPGLKPQKTVAYEVGLKGALSDVWGFTATAFYKDITDLVGTRQVRYGTAYNYAAFVNLDYASVIGFEIGLTKTLSDFWSLQTNYTYSVAKGNSSEPTTGFNDAYEGIPEARQEYYMDFDRRHVANAMLTWMSTRDRYPRLLGTALQGVTCGLIINVASGLPYTPYTGAGEQLAQRNSERMEPTVRFDLRLAKAVLFEPVGVSFYARVENIFDRRNPLRVDSRTGEPWETTLIGNAITYDQIHDPSRVDAPRQILLGVQVNY
ncbi:TonB-dependent receptor [bacterium]|nr:TonB-dependent receptor [bacterium]